ncbi:hypothetical protein B0H16DRAFT_1733354 [Mycena metata]|uniref:Uncharacterized protein n=1 Tax=Mycena metata TaxID=1033252 RepID=A0AAD7MTI3_9AGAR|nr:hypothetical protein B0H16DRAFT_1733354 [Mycena metata]
MTTDHQRPVNDTLVDFGGAVDLMAAHVHTALTTPLSDFPDALGGVITACDGVHNVGRFPPATPTPAPAPPLPSFVRTTAPWAAGLLFGIVPPVPFTAVPDNGGKWFAITRGHYIGLTQNSAISLNAVTGFSEKFSNQVDALAHFNGALASGALAVV